MNNIKLDETKAGFEDGKGWLPIGYFNEEDNEWKYSFEGIFNGNNHKITCLWIDRPDNGYVGLFGYIKNAQIKNLGVEIASKGIVGNENVGGIAGYVSGGNIANSYSIGDVNGKDSVGGIAGNVSYRSSITNSYSTGNISGNENVGGIAGNVCESSITNSYSTGNIKGDNDIGGIAGNVCESSITNSYSTGDINGKEKVGGITGCAGVYGSSYITNSYSTGNIIGKNYVGGITGYAGEKRYRSSYITNSYSTGNIIGKNYVGGTAGYVSGGNITNSYSTGNINGKEKVGGIVGYAENSSITNNAAINSFVKGFESTNRAVGQIKSSKVISNNFTRKALTSGFTEFEESNKYSGIDKDDSEFVSKETYETGLKWKFGNDKDNPWKIDETKNYGLPYLYWQKALTTKRKIFDKASRSTKRRCTYAYHLIFRRRF
jgi:hypothetical protein